MKDEGHVSVFLRSRSAKAFFSLHLRLLEPPRQVLGLVEEGGEKRSK